MAKTLVIVESPAKAKTIEKYLGKEYRVLASVGHVRDLPKSNKDAVDIEAGFVPHYVMTPGKSAVVADIRKEASTAETVLLATDPDREGEAIAWHLSELIKEKLKQKTPIIKRVTYQEITKEAIQEAFKHPRSIDENLRRAQEARRVLDRLVGYDLSGLIWKKVRYGLSAGRVQSPALRILVEREREIKAFIPEQFFTIEGTFTTKSKETFTATASVEPTEEKEALRIVEIGKKGSWSVTDVSETPVKRAPKAPFTTSTLQQTASSRLGFSPSRTMRAAQKLYEAGHITYMRTDSTTLAESAIKNIAGYVTAVYGGDLLEVRTYKTKSKNAQEAHEAVRPTDAGRQEAGATEDERRLYSLIHSRTVASQMKDAGMLRTKITLNIETPQNIPDFSVTGSIVVFDGWLLADPRAKGEDTIVPKVAVNDPLTLNDLISEERYTTPPKRYTEAGLIKELEKRGIGRPSTYASIMKTIQDRGYVIKEARSLMPTATGEVVSTFLENNFSEYISDSFTAEMEDELDQIASGDRNYEKTLRDFYGPFSKDVASKEDIPKLTTLGKAPKEFPCPLCGADMDMKLSKNGVFMSCSRFPDCDGARTEKGEEIKEGDPIGVHPETGFPIFVKNGRFGPYVEMPTEPGDSEQVTGDSKTKKVKTAKVRKPKKPKVRRASIPKDIIPEEITLEQAVHLLVLPRELGTHPETGEMISANIGQYGPYIVHAGDFRSLKGDDDPYTIELDRALEILKEPKKSRAGIETVRAIGPHPRTKKPIVLYKSKRGLFLKKGFKHILVTDAEAEKLTPESAADMLKNS